MEQKSIVYKNILENMSDGVMAIDLSGQIITFNSAAAKILGLEQKEVTGKKFALVFFEYEGNDDFNQAILDAIYESSTSHNRTVAFYNGEKEVFLSLTTSFLKDQGADGKAEKVGVIAVFSDTTELKKLRDAETRLTEDLKANHSKLQDAYLEIEEGNQGLQTALKKVQVIRIVSTIFIILVFLGSGLFFWNKEIMKRPEKSSRSSMTSPSGMPPQMFKVAPKSVSHSISLPGNLEPLRVVNIVSPLSGKVKNKHFRYGDRVEKGQLLLDMDTSDLEVKYREAKAAHIKALQNLRQLENWENGTEVKQARRSLTKASFSLDSQKRKVADTERLFKKGIVPATEYDSAKEQLRSMEIDFTASQEELRAVLKKGKGGNVEIARMESENSRIKMETLRNRVKDARIIAPVSGIIIRPTISVEGKSVQQVEKGMAFDYGSIMFSIGDLTGLSVKTSIDEVDIGKIKKGQRVIITGEAFPGITLEGKITRISSQAKKAMRVPTFDITIIVKRLDPFHQKKIRVGMSADMEVEAYRNQEAIMVPIGAVKTMDGKHFVKIRDGEGKTKEVMVETGITTLDSVEIKKGLSPGENLVTEN